MSEMQHTVLHYRLERMMSVEKQPEELLAHHEGIGLDSKHFDDLKIQLFSYQIIFDMEHNHPKKLETVRLMVQRILTNQHQPQHSNFAPCLSHKVT